MARIVKRTPSQAGRRVIAGEQPVAASSEGKRASREVKARAGARRRNAAEAARHAARMKARLLAAARIAFHLGGED